MVSLCRTPLPSMITS
uniref:Uncharacterized protein n=1 Tax=Rhizophora mucronata TaxID=61149 RepID=A0A2P2PT33_RHIMU